MKPESFELSDLVTNEEWRAFCTATGRTFDKTGRPRQPVVYVSWHEAVVYAEWRGDGWRLPWEWELAFAEMQGRDRDFSAWPLPGLPDVGTHPEADGGGPADLLGVVYQWCGDASGRRRIRRGGSHLYLPLRSAVRHRLENYGLSRYGSLGFRLAAQVGAYAGCARLTGDENTDQGIIDYCEASGANANDGWPTSLDVECPSFESDGES